MLNNNEKEKITSGEESRAREIAMLASKLPEKEQEKIFYMMKGIELAGSQVKTYCNQNINARCKAL